MSLPASLKNLLKLRSPNAFPGPGLGDLTPTLAMTLKEAAVHKAENGWLAVATATFLTANSPSSVGDLYRFASRRPVFPNSSSSSSTSVLLPAAEPFPLKERVRIAALMREAGLKCTVFVGVPKVINSLAGLTESLDDDVKKELTAIPHRTHLNGSLGTEKVMARGHKLFESIYYPYTSKLLTKLGTYHPDFPGFIIANEYGALLSDPPEWNNKTDGVINRTLTSAAGVACLRAGGGVGPQLTSHVYGLLKAKEYGDVLSEGDQWLASVDGATWIIGLVDQLADLVHAPDVVLKDVSAQKSPL